MPSLLNRKIFSVFISLSFLITLALIFPIQNVLATCTQTSVDEPCNSGSSNVCLNTGPNSATGIVVYGCGTYRWGVGCYCHTYTCDTQCSSTTTDTCGGNPGSCSGSCSGGKTCGTIAPSADNPNSSCGCKGGSSGGFCRPVITAVTPVVNNPSQMITTWDYSYPGESGNNGRAQGFFMGTDQGDISNQDCSHNTCVAATLSLPYTQSSIGVGNLAYDTTYYVMVTQNACHSSTIVRYKTPVYTCTAPGIVSIARKQPNSDSSAVVITWTPGTNTINQTVYYGTNKTWVTNNCPAGSSAPGCKAVSVAKTATTYTVPAGSLSTGAVYYFKVLSGDICGKSSSINPYLTSCAVSPTNTIMGVNSSAVIHTTINTDPLGTVNKVTYSSSSPGIATVTAQDTVSPFSTTATSGSTPGSTIVTSKAYSGATLLCTNTGNVTVIQNNPWWQVKDADVGTNGDLKSGIPGGQMFDLPGPGGFPGIPVYGGNTTLDSTNVSTPQKWLANTTQDSSKVYDSHFFANQIPSDVVFNPIDQAFVSDSLSSGGTPDSKGFYWYKWDGTTRGDLTLNSAVNLGSRKVILWVDSANFNINNTINLTKGQGFFMVIVGKSVDASGNTSKGNIFVDPSVGGGASPNLEGIYMADGSFKTGTNGSIDTQLWVRGSVMGDDAIIFDRDLGGGSNSTTPAELFEYAPDQIMLYPSALSARKISWKEVTP